MFVRVLRFAAVAVNGAHYDDYYENANEAKLCELSRQYSAVATAVAGGIHYY